MNFSNEINELIEDFSFFDSWEDKYQYLIDMGRNVPQMDEALKTEENKMKGCQSLVYFYKYYNEDGTITFLANSDAAIVQGLIALMLKVFSGKKPQEILDTNINFLEQIGLNDHLSPQEKMVFLLLSLRLKNQLKRN